MRAEIVTTGTELLLGQIDDTNATYLARQLRDLGIDLYFRSTVGDNEARIAQAVELALGRADLVIVTGGLGPTVDDVTREAVARATGRPLVLYPDLLEQIRAFFTRIGAVMTDNNRKQACLPEGCLPIENPVGTAPAFVVEDSRGAVITLPGVPREMKYLMENAVLPYLRQRLGVQEHIVTRVLRTVGIGESRIDAAIADLEQSANPTVGLSAHPAQTDVRIVAKAAVRKDAETMVAEFEARIRERLGAAVFGVGEAPLEEVVANLLRERGASLAVAETVTQGELARRLSAYPDAFRGGLVAYDAAGLSALLSAPGAQAAPFSAAAGPAALSPASGAGTPEAPGAAPSGPERDPEAAAADLARAVRRAASAAYGLAVVEADPVGPWVAVASETGTETRHLRYPGRDHRARTWTAVLSLEFLRRLLLNLAGGWAQ
jgi:nicotinamide-nucleotide amidase